MLLVIGSGLEQFRGCNPGGGAVFGCLYNCFVLLSGAVLMADKRELGIRVENGQALVFAKADVERLLLSISIF